MIFPIKLVNEDGTDCDFEYPQNPLEEKWNKLYPPIPKPEYSQTLGKLYDYIMGV
ncbi:MAG: hypothetical protein NC489_28990 [Ruminococcus flavefaciens]|nr:hypothetical protein [Ruminococcus flavefaciens]